MHPSKRFAIGIVAGLMAVSLIGCTEKGGGTPKKDEQVGSYTTKGSLNEVNMELKDIEDDRNLRVQTKKGIFEGAYKDGKLYYIGPEPNKEGEIEVVFEEKENKVGLKKADFKEAGGALWYAYNYEEGEDIIGARVEVNSEPISAGIHFEDKVIKVEIKGIELKDEDSIDLYTTLYKEKGVK